MWLVPFRPERCPLGLINLSLDLETVCVCFLSLCSSAVACLEKGAELLPN